MERLERKAELLSIIKSGRTTEVAEIWTKRVHVMTGQVRCPAPDVSHLELARQIVAWEFPPATVSRAA